MDRLTLLPCPFCGREPQQRMRYADGDQMSQPYLGVRCEHHTDWITSEQWNSLQSLSQEAVRDEAFEEAAKECGLCASRQVTKHDQKVRDQTRRDLAKAIRALKREPNAAAQADLGPETDGTPGRSASGSPGGGAVHPDAEARAWGSEPGGASDRGARAGNVVAGPAPAAPDVESMVKRLRDYRCADPWAGALIIEAAALLAKLGQEQSPFVVNWTTEGCPKHNGQPWTMKTTTVYTEIGKRCPLCNPPGASDETQS